MSQSLFLFLFYLTALSERNEEKKRGSCYFFFNVIVLVPPLVIALSMEITISSVAESVLPLWIKAISAVPSSPITVGVTVCTSQEAVLPV